MSVVLWPLIIVHRTKQHKTNVFGVCNLVDLIVGKMLVCEHSAKCVLECSVQLCGIQLLQRVVVGESLQHCLHNITGMTLESM